MTCARCRDYPDIQKYIDWQKTDRQTPCPITEDRRGELFAVCKRCGEKAARKNGEADTFDHKGRSQVCWEATDFSTVELGFDLARRPGETVGCTTLDHAVEDALRVLLTTLFQLDPLEVLLIQHYLQGRTASAFRETLAALRDRLSKRYDLSEESQSFRATCHAWKKKIVAKLPALADLFDAVNRDCLTHKTRMSAEDAGPMRQVIFDAHGGGEGLLDAITDAAYDGGAGRQETAF